MNGFGGIGGWELLLVAVIAMLLLGPERMVQHAYRIGRWSRKLSRYWQEGVTAFREQVKDIEEDAVGDRSELSELKELATEIRLEDGLTDSASVQAAPDVSTQTDPEIASPGRAAAEAASSNDPKTAAEQQISYNAWRSPKSPQNEP